MSLKTKLTSLIISFVLLASLLVVGVFAVKQTNFGLGGSIVFNAKGVEAQIELLSLSEDALIEGTAGTDVMKTVTIDSSLLDAKDASTWENVKLGFNEAGDDVTMQIKITNTYPTTDDVTKNNYLDITGLTDGNTIKNAKVKVRNTTRGSENGITALLAPKDSATFTVTFSVKDKGTHASIEGQLVNFELNHLPYSEIPLATADSRLTITCNDAEKTASVTGNSITEANTSIEIPKYVRNCENGVVCAVTSIGNSAFYKCSGLTSIEIGDSVTSIGAWTFYSCTSLTDVVIGHSVQTIQVSSFDYCTGIKSINVSSGNAVYEDRGLNAIVEKETNTIFLGCKNSVIDNTITDIGSYAFANCSGLTSVVIPDSVQTIGYKSFNICRNLTTVEIGNNVTSIGENAFYYCDKLTSIVFPDSVVSIGSYAFQQCSGLTSIEIGDSLTSIGEQAFWGCPELASIRVSLGNEKYQDRSLNAIVEKETNTIFFGCKNSTIDNTITAIGENAFRGCRRLASIEITDSVETIGAYAFYSCDNLESVVIGDNVTSIGENAFDGCSNLTSIEIPDSVKTLGESVFSNCSGLESVVIGDGVQVIEEYTFYECESLTTVVIGESVQIIDSSAFYICYNINEMTVKAATPPTLVNALPTSIKKIYIPTGSMSAYTSAEYWKNFDASVFEEKDF